MDLYYLLLNFVIFLKTYVISLGYIIKQTLEKHVSFKEPSSFPGKVAIVTGGSGGIGFAISRRLAAKQIHVIIAGRNKGKIENAAEKIRNTVQGAKVTAMQLDLVSFQSVASFVDRFLALGIPLHLLINNAGVMFAPYMITEDGFESQAQVNFYSHFYLTQLLLPKLKESGADNSWSRIVNVSSKAHHLSNMDLSTFGKRLSHWCEYSPHAAYCNSKLAVIMATYHLHKLLRADHSKVSVNAVHPGVVNTELFREVSWPLSLFVKVMVLVLKSADQGADVCLYTALSPEREGHSGHYYDNCLEVKSMPLSYSEDMQRELYQNTLEVIEQKKCK